MSSSAMSALRKLSREALTGHLGSEIKKFAGEQVHKLRQTDNTKACCGAMLDLTGPPGSRAGKLSLASWALMLLYSALVAL